MTLDEAIKHAEEVAEEKFNNAVSIMDKMKSDIALSNAEECKLCAEEHRQLAEWLKDYKRLKEQEPRKDEVILTKEEYGELVSSEFDNGYAKGYREALEQEPTTKNDLGVDCISRTKAMNVFSVAIRDEDVKNMVLFMLKSELYFPSVAPLTELPSVTPQEPRKGHWIETAEEYYKAVNEKGGGVNENTDFFTDDIACSECLAKFSIIDNEAERFDYCPCCGSYNKQE